MSEDAELLRRYLEEKSQAAFAELVRRHINLVYSVALRQVAGDVHLAEDVVQQVFTALAQKAGTLAGRPTLTGWLYRSTHFAASDVVRGERRRRVREQEAHAMQEIHAAPAGETDWEKVRPAIDAAIAELDERDRDAVSLRFFDGCSWAEVGGRLRLTENAARMRVERALDKLHAALARRGVTSSATALGLALSNQAVVAAPVNLATAVTGAAWAGGAAAAAGVGALAFLGTAKFAAGLAVGAAVVAGGTAVVQYQRARDADLARVSLEKEGHALRAEADTFAARLAQAERRTAEVEKDNGELLKAIEAQRVQAARTAAAVPVAPSRPNDEAERLDRERMYQQQLARSRVTEAQLRAGVQSRAAEVGGADGFALLFAAAESCATNGDFSEARRFYNLAMAAKPADLPVPERARELQAALAAQNLPVPVSLLSDGETWVMISGVFVPRRFVSNIANIPPGNYQVVGRRTGYRDVEVALRVRNGEPPPVVSVVCTLRVQ
ncbi:MAG TPA: sigma-70 family RNA polymerase sigma factor [Opitutaceae bacterium]|nr:sigma-70 family RNA polymerase sigma factor [Opitutaceae bacterium]